MPLIAHTINHAINSKIFTNILVSSDSNKIINISSVKANTRYYLNGVKKGKFTKITQEKNKFIIYFVKEKKDINILSFEKVKDKIFQIIMKERENKFLKQHFNKLRLEANIEVLR